MHVAWLLPRDSVRADEAELDQLRCDCAGLALVGAGHRRNGLPSLKPRAQPLSLVPAPGRAVTGGSPVLPSRASLRRFDACRVSPGAPVRGSVGAAQAPATGHP